MGGCGTVGRGTLDPPARCPCLGGAGVRPLVNVRRFPGGRDSARPRRERLASRNRSAGEESRSQPLRLTAGQHLADDSRLLLADGGPIEVAGPAEQLAGSPSACAGPFAMDRTRSRARRTGSTPRR